jgi:Na+-driven multidrug efflux pump
MLFVRNDGKPVLSMTGVIALNVVNIVFDLIFINIFKMGIRGAAIALVLGAAISSAIYIPHIIKSKNLKIRIFDFDIRLFLQIAKSGASSSVTFLFQFITIIIFNNIIIRLGGEKAGVIFAVVSNLIILSSTILEGVGLTAQPLISHSHGANDREGIRKILKLSSITSVAFSVILSGLYFGYAPAITQVFGIQDAATISACSVEIRVFTLSAVFMGFNYLRIYHYQSTERLVQAAQISFCRSFIFIMTFGVVFSFIYGTRGVYLAYPLVEALTLASSLIFSKYVSRNKSVVIQ